MVKVEFIESYIKLEDGDYQWSDNHGALIRCGDCARKGTKSCPVWLKANLIHDDDYCSWGVRLEGGEDK